MTRKRAVRSVAPKRKIIKKTKTKPVKKVVMKKKVITPKRVPNRCPCQAVTNANRKTAAKARTIALHKRLAALKAAR